jgi:hypothetical protein
MLVQEEIARRAEANSPYPEQVLKDSAMMLDRVGTNLHVLLEQENVFPAYMQAGGDVNLVTILTQQHDQAALIMQQIISMQSPNSQAGEVARLIRLHSAMYRPHTAREETQIFRELKKMVGPGEYQRLSRTLTAREMEVLGENGFEQAVTQVADMERQMGIDNLAQFTPQTGQTPDANQTQQMNQVP